MPGTLALAQEKKSLVERLGFGKDDRVLMIHADDVGMCHSVNAATIKAMTEGVVSSSSIMVPCPWFPEIAAWAREHPEADLGLHLTLTSEWRYYRWRPVSAPEKVPGLMDPEGFLWRGVGDVVGHASAAEVELEIRAQIDRARKFGLKPTHVDSHMGTLFAHPEYFEAYVRVAKECGILPMLPRPTADIADDVKQLGLDYPAVTARLDSEGFILLDRLSTGLTGGTLEERRKSFQEFVRGLRPGVTELICHLSGDDAEIRHVTGNWEARWNELRLFTDADTRAFLKEQGVRSIGYRQLAALWKPAAPGA